MRFCMGKRKGEGLSAAGVKAPPRGWGVSEFLGGLRTAERGGDL